MKVKSKAEVTRNALSIASGHIVPCKKKRLDNIVLPPWAEVAPISAESCPLYLNTKEGESHYNEGTFRIVLRILGGKVFGTDGKPDVYAWGPEKVEKYLSDPSKLPRIGKNSDEGMVNFAKVIAQIPNEDEKLAFAHMLRKDYDCLMVTSEEEDRRCFELTQELYDAGLTFIVDSWMEPDKKTGLYRATELRVGDFVIVESDEKIYCIRRDEFLETHELV